MRRLPVLLLFLAPLGAADPAWNGTWSLRQAPDMAKAIEAATAGMNFLTRPIARGRLTKLNPVYQRVALTQGPSEVTVKFDDRAPIRMPADGRAVAWTREDGEVFQVSARLQGDVLVQHLQGADGARTNTFRLDAARQLSLSVEVKSAKLSGPLTYTLMFGPR